MRVEEVRGTYRLRDKELEVMQTSTLAPYASQEDQPWIKTEMYLTQKIRGDTTKMNIHIFQLHAERMNKS